MSLLGRPSQKLQSSRKGKKAWRKNIDLDDLEMQIEEKRKEVEQLGDVIENVNSEELFTIDTKGGSSDSSELLKKERLTKLKADEIIANSSKVIGLVHPKHSLDADKKKKKSITGKDVQLLMKIAGRIQGVSTSTGMINAHGIAKAELKDVWDEEIEDKTSRKKVIPDILKEQSSNGHTKASVVPKTMKHLPVKVKQIETIPHSGKSYNPSLESWKDLINSEFYKEKSKDDKRKELEAYQENIRELINRLDEKEEREEDEEVNEDSSDDEKSENFDEFKSGLSANKAVQRKKKTRTKRNKQKRHQERVKLEQELKELKKQITELQRLRDIEKEVEIKQSLILEKKNKTKKRKSEKLGTKYHVMDDALEVKLSDELNDSLRKLKPEGNLLYDQMRNLQSKGKIESRLPVKKKRRYTPKVTEKWSYKDFK